MTKNDEVIYEMVPDQDDTEEQEKNEDSSGTYRIPGIAFSTLGALVSAQTPQPVSPARVVADLYAVKEEYADTFMKMLEDANRAAVEHRNAETECLRVQTKVALRWQWIFCGLFVVLIWFCWCMVRSGNAEEAVRIFRIAATLLATGFGGYCLVKVINGFSRNRKKKDETA